MAMLNKIKHILLSSTVGVIVAGVLACGVVLAAEQIINNFYGGNATLNQSVPAAPAVDEDVLGGVTAPDPGLCSNGDAYTNLCSVAIHGAFNRGGVLSLTAATNTTVSATQICDNSVISLATNNDNVNITLPTTANLALDCFPNIGDSRTVAFVNASTTNATIVAGTGQDLQEPDGQNVVITNLDYVWLDFIKLTDTTMVVRVDETIPAD